MTIRVKLFAIAKDQAGTGETTVDVPDGSSVSTAVSELERRFPKLTTTSFATAVNRAYAPRDSVLQSNDELALIPPVSGG
ncbi:MAG: MoaD/ThiS family protein [Tepidisphaeraceae bacterium]